MLFRSIKDKFNFDINDIIININNGNELSIEYNFKYKISSSYLNHHFELFLTKIDDFAGLVSQFHLPCVRGYYNGNLYLLPSCISAHLTYINIDYKYFCGVNDPIGIISKYYFRGFYTLINNYEKNQIIKYNNLIITTFVVIDCSPYCKVKISIRNIIFELSIELFSNRGHMAP